MNNSSTDPFLSQDGAERDLVAEINAKTKLPITKQVTDWKFTLLYLFEETPSNLQRTALTIKLQDSYGHAIYHGAARKNVKNVKKQGEA